MRPRRPPPRSRTSSAGGPTRPRRSSAERKLSKGAVEFILLMQMAVHVVLLRGVNLVKRNRISMPELRSALTAAGFRDVSTYVQSGNAVLSSRASGEGVVRDVGAVIRKSFG